MTTSRPISFAELRQFLKGLGYHVKRSETAWIFHHPTEGLLVFRQYREADAVDEGDLRSTRKFLDLRGLVAGRDFDAFMRQAAAPA